MSTRLQNSTPSVYFSYIRRSGFFLVITIVLLGALRGSAAQQPAPALFVELPAGLMVRPSEALAASETLSARAVSMDVSALAADAIDLDV
jgi:hypothetical protein